MFDAYFVFFLGGTAKTKTKEEGKITKTRSDWIMPGSTQKAASTHTIRRPLRGLEAC